MADNNRIDHLYKIFQNVNDWLKFSEAKNAMLIAFNGASIYGLMKLLDLNTVKTVAFFQVILVIVIGIIVISTVVALISFVPQVTIVKPEEWFARDISKNIFFFEYLKNQGPEEILREVSQPDEPADFSTLERDLAVQIQQNSIIASRKFGYFTIALWITIAAYITVVVAGLLFWLTYFRNRQVESQV